MYERIVSLYRPAIRISEAFLTKCQSKYPGCNSDITITGGVEAVQFNQVYKLVFSYPTLLKNHSYLIYGYHYVVEAPKIMQCM